MFEDHKNDPVALMYAAVLLLYRLLMGVFIGSLATSAATAEAQANDNRKRQTTALLLVSVCMLLFVVSVRPYAVPAAVSATRSFGRAS